MAKKDEGPEDLIYMHHKKTGGVKAIRRRQLAFYQAKGWAEGNGGSKDLGDVPTSQARVESLPEPVAPAATSDATQVPANSTATAKS